jgi:DNA-binding response OmpR family regulator
MYMSQVLFLSSDPVLTHQNLDTIQNNGLEADSTSGCLEGLVMIGKNNFDVIVIDDKLSDVSGYEACLKVRHWKKHALIVLLGDIPDLDAWSRVKELGFDLYLRKPVNPEELLTRIKALLKRPSAEKKAAASAAVKPVAFPLPKNVAVPAKAKDITARTKLKGKDANRQTADSPVAPAKPIGIVSESAKFNRKEQAPMESPQIKRDISRPPTAPIISSSPVPLPGSMAGGQAQTGQEEAAAAILEDPRVIKLVDALVSGKLPDINPVIDFSYKNGFAYPAVSSLLDTSEVDTINILESLAGSGILIKETYEDRKSVV